MADQQKKSYTATKGYAFLWYVPVVAILAITPLIVYLSVRPVPKAFRRFWTADINFDFFSFYKTRWFLFWSVVLLLSFLFCLYKRKDEYLSFVRRTKYFWMAWIVFTFSILLSAVLSPAAPIAWWGMFDRYEGGWVWLAYSLLLAACAFLPRQDTDFHYFTGAIIFSTTVIALIGIPQYFGMDIFRSDFGLWLILPAKFITADLGFIFGKGTIYSTFYNTNYGGSIAGIALPLAVCLCLFVPSFKRGGLLLLGYTLLIFVLATGSRSQAGAIGLFVAFTFLIIYLARHYRSKITPLFLIFALFTPIYIGMDRYAGGEISGKFASTLLGDKGAISVLVAGCRSQAGTIGLFVAFTFLIIYLARHYRSNFKRLVLIFAIFAPIYIGVDIYFDGPVSGKFTDIFWGDKLAVEPSVADALIEQQKHTTPMQAKIKVFFDKKIIEYGLLGSGRGYIYLRALEQRLTIHSVLGTGPDTFAIFSPRMMCLGRIAGIR